MEITYTRLTRERGEHIELLEQMLEAYFGEIFPEYVPRSGEIAQDMLDDAAIPGRHIEFAYAPNGTGGLDMIGFICGSAALPSIGGSNLPKRDGYGLIVEFYVKPEYRLLGYGSKMAKRLEQLFEEDGMARSYLTADGAAEFWLKLGYEPTGEIAEWNGDPIYEKRLAIVQ